MLIFVTVKAAPLAALELLGEGEWAAGPPLPPDMRPVTITW